MLSGRMTRLLTAYVDGELTGRPREALRNWLRRSPEARELLRALQGDADRLRSLPRPSLGPDFAQQVLQAIDSRKGESPQRSALTFPSQVSVWLGLATAAAVLLVIGLGSYLYFTAADRAQQPSYAVRAPKESSQRPMTAPAEPRVSDPPAPQARRGELVGVPTLKKVAPEAQAKVVPPTAGSSLREQKAPAGPKQPALASPLQESTLDPLKDPTPPLPSFLISLREFDADKQKQLQDVLQKDPAHWIELQCPDTLAGMERLQAAFKSQGIQIILDQDAEAVLKLRLGTNPPFALYLDDVTPGEMIAVLQQFSSADRKPEATSRRAGPVQSLLVNTMGRDERQKLGRLLGIDAKQLDAPVPKSRPNVNITKPLAKITEEQVLAFLRGRGAAATDSAKSAGKTFERRALVVTYVPNSSRTSAVVKQFLETRTVGRPIGVCFLLFLQSLKH